MITETDFLQALGFERPDDIIMITVPTRICRQREEVYGWQYMTSTALRDITVFMAGGGSSEAQQYWKIMFSDIVPSLKKEFGDDFIRTLQSRIEKYPESFDPASQTSIFRLYGYYVAAPTYGNRVTITMNAKPDAKRDLGVHRGLDAWRNSVSDDGLRSSMHKIPRIKVAPRNPALRCEHKSL